MQSHNTQARLNYVLFNSLALERRDHDATASQSMSLIAFRHLSEFLQALIIIYQRHIYYMQTEYAHLITSQYIQSDGI